MFHEKVCVYPCEYKDDCKKFNKTSLLEKEHFYSHISMEDITEVDYGHTKTVSKHFKTKNLGKYYVESNSLFVHYSYQAVHVLNKSRKCI